MWQLDVENLLISFASNINNTESLSTLTLASQYFPKIAHLIPKNVFNDNVLQLSKKMIEFETGFQQVLYLNDIEIDVDEIDVYSYFNFNVEYSVVWEMRIELLRN